VWKNVGEINIGMNSPHQLNDLYPQDMRQN
jgi:hypothetical protein